MKLLVLTTILLLNNYTLAEADPCLLSPKQCVESEDLPTEPTIPSRPPINDDGPGGIGGSL